MGNTLVLVLVRAQQWRRRSLLNCFLLNLAATDLQFVLTLPFWAADTVRDFSWPFGGAMCKVVLTLTVLNMYASSFFLSAMSMDRYRTVANALRPRQPGTPWAGLRVLPALGHRSPGYRAHRSVCHSGQSGR